MPYPKKLQPIANVPKTKPTVLNRRPCSIYSPKQTQLFQSFDEQIFKTDHDHDLKIKNGQNQQIECLIASFPYWRILRISQTVLNFRSLPFRFTVPICAHLQIFFTSNKPFLTKIVLKDRLKLFLYVFLFIYCYLLSLSNGKALPKA